MLDLKSHASFDFIIVTLAQQDAKNTRSLACQTESQFDPFRSYYELHFMTYVYRRFSI